MMDTALAADVLALCRDRQHTYYVPDATSPEKRAAKARAAALVAQALDGGTLLDIGGEDFYAPDFAQHGLSLVARNLPDDMHDPLPVGAWYDGAVAMHVLEHSPFPLYLLVMLRRVVRTGGVLYVAVPHPRRKWMEHASHFTTLHPVAWARLLADAGWTITHQETGPFGPKSLEERFVCA